MRRLMWFAVGFSATCGIWAYKIEYLWALFVLLAAGAGAGFLLKKASVGWVVIWMLLGCILASLWTNIYQNRLFVPALAVDGMQKQLTITASDYSYDTSYRLAVDGSAELDGEVLQVRAYLKKTEEIQEICPGDRLTGLFQLRTTVPGSGEESVYHQGKGIFLIAYSQGDVIINQPENLSIREYPAVVARNMEDNLRKIFPEDVFAFAKALLLGNTHELDYETDTALKISGIRHIVAVSGLHISVLYGAIAAATGRKRFLTAIIALPVLLLYAAVVGFTPSVTRACLMVALMILSTVFMRTYDTPTALSFACLVIMCRNPLTITDVGFQMSVLCVAGILLFQQRIKAWLVHSLPGKGKWHGWLCASVSVTLSAMSLVTPLSAYYFGTVSLISPVTNLLTLWLVTGIFIGLLLSCAISFVSVGIASILGWILAWPIRFVLLSAKLCASLPLAAVYTASRFIVAWVAFCYVLLLLHLLRQKSGSEKGICLAVFGLCIALTVSILEPVADDVRITMLDVGQGQSIVIQTNGKVFLIDCGGEDEKDTADIIAEHLLSQGISRLDGIVITHYDNDHAGALGNLLTRVDTNLLIFPDLPGAYQPEHEVNKTMYLWDTTEISLGKNKLTVFGPVFHGESNENSLCVLFESENCDILITGDRTGFGERMLMRRAQLPDVDILVAGHHGAENSSSEELLQVVKPELVLISVGKDNIYGHPNPKLLQRLYDAGVSVRRTDLEGTIIIRR